MTTVLERRRAEVRAEMKAPLAACPRDHPLCGSVSPSTRRELTGSSRPTTWSWRWEPRSLYYPGASGPMVEEGTKVLQITEDLDETNRQQGRGDPRGRGNAARCLIGFSPTSQPNATGRP